MPVPEAPAAVPQGWCQQKLLWRFLRRRSSHATTRAGISGLPPCSRAPPLPTCLAVTHGRAEPKEPGAGEVQEPWQDGALASPGTRTHFLSPSRCFCSQCGGMRARSLLCQCWLWLSTSSRRGAGGGCGTAEGCPRSWGTRASLWTWPSAASTIRVKGQTFLGSSAPQINAHKQHFNALY